MKVVFRWIHGRFCRHRYNHVRALSFCRHLLVCEKCGRFFEENVGVPGAPIVPALKSDLPPEARAL